jgi:DNA ligase (NAD+)
LLAIKGFGQKTVDSLFAYLSDVHMRERIARLRKCGLQFEEHDVATSEQCEQVFSGQTWCVTGSFTHFSPRSLALKEIESRGGRTTGAVTGKTTHLLAGTGAGSKLQQAIGFGTTIVSEEEFLKMLEGEG